MRFVNSQSVWTGYFSLLHISFLTQYLKDKYSATEYVSHLGSLESLCCLCYLTIWETVQKKKKNSSFNLLSGTASSSLWSLFSCMHFKKQAALFFRASQASSTSDWCFNLYVVSWVGRWPLSCRTSKLICSNICITQTFSFNVHTFFFFFFLGDLRMWKDGRTQKYLPTLKRKWATFNFSQLSSFFCDL